MPWFEYDGPNSEGVSDRDTEMAFIRENMPLEREAESACLVNDFILCLEEMRGSDKGSPTWECARSDARGRLTDLCDLADVSAEDVIGFDI